MTELILVLYAAGAAAVVAYAMASFVLKLLRRSIWRLEDS